MGSNEGADQASQLVARLERLPFTRYQIMFVLVLAVGLFFDQFDLGELSGTIPAIAREFALNSVAITTVIASGFVGMFIGALLSGYMADRFGRKRLFVYTLLIIAAGSFLMGLSQTYIELIAFRALAGFGIGGDIPIVWSYLSELVPARNRGKWFGVAVPIGLVGFPASAFAALYFIPLSPAGWRYVFFIGALIAIIVWPLRAVTPESPRFHLSRGEYGRAAEILKSVEERVQRAYGRPLPPPDMSMKYSIISTKPSYKDLFSKGLRATTIQISLIEIFQTIAYYGVISFLPLILIAKGFTLVRAILFTAITFIGQLVGSGLLMAIGDKIQRRHQMAIGSAAAAIFGFLFAFSSTESQVLTFGFMLNVGSQLFYAGMAAYTPEIFPGRLRATGSGFSYSVGRFFNIIGLYVIGVALAGQPTSQLGLVGGFYILILILSVVLGMSTAKKTLEEITETQKM